MQALRSILKTIRIPENINEEIEKFQGENFNDKINNLLEFYILQQQEYLKYLKELEVEIEQKKKLLDEFKDKIRKFQDLLN